MTALITAIDITNPIGRTFTGTAFDFPWGNIDNIDNFDNAAIISFSKYRQLSQFSGNTGPGTQ